MDKTITKVFLTIGVIILFLSIWVFVFKATNYFDSTSGDWICMGALALIISVPTTIGILIYLHTRD